MDNQQQQWVRWYDKYPNISLIMKLTEHLPKHVQTHVGDNLYGLVQKYYEVLEQNSDLKSLGPEVVMSLNKSLRKQRWYDEIPTLHKALNMMLTMPEPLVHHLDDRCTTLLDYVKKESLRKPMYVPPSSGGTQSGRPSRSQPRKPYYRV